MAAALTLATLAVALLSADGQTVSAPAQIPLGTQTANVIPNIVMIFDDSGSMTGTFIYRSYSSTLWGGSVTQDGMGVDPSYTQAQYAHCSAQVNALYYDPSLRYYPPQNSDSSYKTYTTYNYRDPNGVFDNPYNNSPSTICQTASGTSGVNYPRILKYNGGAYTSASNYTTVTLSPSTSSYTKSSARTDCVASANSCSYAEELANFSIWYQYHSNRVLMLSTAMSQTFDAYDSTFRLGWATLNNAANSNVLEAGVGLFTGAVKTAFYTFVNALPNNIGGSTPSLDALNTVAKYFQRVDGDGPWGSTPNTTSRNITAPSSPVSAESMSAMASCRRSSVMFVTDGYWNSNTGSNAVSVGNVDGTAQTAVSGPYNSTFTYTPVAPFKDNASNTLADVAMTYWVKDLTTMSNTVPSANGDPAFWQHLNFHAITLGVNGQLDQDSSTVMSQLNSGALSWPTPVANSVSTIDDIWHATVNTYGSMINAANAAELNAALSTVVAKASATPTSRATVALSSNVLSVGTRKFAPSYNPGDWTGNLVATELDTTDSANGAASTVTWKVESVVNNVEVHTLGNSSTRKIYAGNGASTGARAVAFDYTTLSSYGLLSRVGSSITQDRIDYLRGSRAQEGVNGSFRSRSSLLGDIVNSLPLYIAGPTGSGDGAVFVGANDGMLHAFHEATGAEVFAYVPYAVLPKIAQLADKSYSHQYTVDGPLTPASVPTSSGTTTYVVGTTGAGAASVFALDASSPQAMTAANVAWEITPASVGYSELGYILSPVAIGQTVSGDWVAVFGNGYYSASRTAKLYVANLSTGALIKVLEPNNTLTANGMGGVSLVFNASQRIIGAYAGDLRGNVWKFDLNASSSGSWKVGISNLPLFTAKDSAGVAQPITMPPYSTLVSKGGRLVTVGTGKFFDSSDLSSTGLQSVYGLWDSAEFGSTSDTTTVSGTSSLVLQTVSAQTSTTVTVSSVALGGAAASSTVTYFNISASPVALSGTVRGWYFNLNYKAGQRVVLPMASAGLPQFVKIDSIIPGSVTDQCTPAFNGSGVTLVVDLLTGGTPAGAVMDTNHNGRFDSGDTLNVSGFTTNQQSGTSVLDTSRQTQQASSNATLAFTNVVDQVERLKLDLCAITGVGCPSVVPTRRNWRQIFMR